MRLGIDLTAYDPESVDGVSTFCLGLVDGFLRNLSTGEHLTILVSSKNKKFFLEKYPNNITFIELNFLFYEKIINRFVWILSWVLKNYSIRYWIDKYLRSGTKNLIQKNVDALIVPTTVFNFFSLEIPTILCIHDIQQEYFPRNFRLSQRILRWASYRLSCEKASLIQVSSLYIKECIIEKFSFVELRKIFIAPEGVDFSKFSSANLNVRCKKLNMIDSNEFIFYPAQIWKHKNHLLLINALAEYKKLSGIELPCVLTGSDYGFWGCVQNLINALDLKKVYYLGRVDFRELVWLYANCKAVLALGVHESSSLPVREGSVFGRPIICVDIPPNLEVAKHLNLEIVGQSDPLGLAKTLFDLDLNQIKLRSQAIKNIELIKKFDWSNIAPIYVEAIKNISTGIKN